MSPSENSRLGNLPGSLSKYLFIPFPSHEVPTFLPYVGRISGFAGPSTQSPLLLPMYCSVFSLRPPQTCRLSNTFFSVLPLSLHPCCLSLLLGGSIFLLPSPFWLSLPTFAGFHSVALSPNQIHKPNHNILSLCASLSCLKCPQAEL